MLLQFTADTKSLENILNIRKKFEQYAGLKVNKTETEALWLGKNINNVNMSQGRIVTMGVNSFDSKECYTVTLSTSLSNGS